VEPLDLTDTMDSVHCQESQDAGVEKVCFEFELSITFKATIKNGEKQTFICDQRMLNENRAERFILAHQTCQRKCSSF